MRTSGRAIVALVIAFAGTATIAAADPPPIPDPPAGCTPPTDGRVALWRGENTVEDSAGMHHGALAGETAGFSAGAVGTAFALAGNRDHARVPDATDLNITGDVTFDAWVQIDDLDFGAPDSSGVGGDRLILWKVDEADTDITFAFWIEGDVPATAAAAPLGFSSGTRTDPSIHVRSEALAWQKDTWYHVAVARSGPTVTFYRDGRPAGSATIGGTPVATPAAPLSLGAGASAGTVFNPIKGAIDEAQLWSRGLGADEVEQIHASATGACTPPPPPDPTPTPTPTPTPAPEQAPRNVARPSIEPARECPTQIGGGGACRPVAHTYRCDPGTWEGHDPSLPYVFTWQRYSKPTATDFGGYKTVASGETLSASSSTQVGMAESNWRYRCAVEARNAAGATSAVSDPRQLEPKYEPGAGPRNPTVDVRVTGIEATQGIQQECPNCVGVLPSRDQTTLSDPADVDYRGVRLAAGKYTVARVFADYRHSDGRTRPLPGVTARLEVSDSAGRLLAVLTPDFSPGSVPSAPSDGRAQVTRAERGDAAAAFTFVIPWQQTERRSLSLRAIAQPARSGLAPLKQCAGCNGNVFTLRNIPFVRTEQIRVRPVRINSDGMNTTSTVEQLFASSQELMPGFVQYFPFPAEDLDVPRDKLEATALVAQWAADRGYPPSDVPVGIFRENVDQNGTSLNGLGGVTVHNNAVLDPGGRLGAREASIARDSRPVTSVAHEIGHQLGLHHADNECGGNSDDQVGLPNPWWNTRGTILGFGLQRQAPRPRVFQGTDHYDFMSYCGYTSDHTSPDHWIGLGNWDTLLARNAPAVALPARRARASAPAVRRPVRVIVTVDGAGAAKVLSIAPGREAGVPGDAGGPYRLEFRDAGGKVAASAEPAVQTIVPHGEPSGRMLTATLDLAPSATELLVRRGDEVIARQARSAHPPVATIVTPRAGAVGDRATTAVRWRASDADGDRLTTTIDYSGDGGRTWKVLASGLTGRSARLASRELSASADGRVRVRVSDGFDAAIVVSGRLRSRGTRPLVRIASRLGRLRSDALVLLQGGAFDDAGRALTGSRLRWYAGRRFLGSGERVSAQGLPAGTRAIRLVATDARGRSAAAVIRIRVTAVAPQFLEFDGPATVARSARMVQVRVASTLPATLRIAGGRYAVGRTPRRLVVPLRGRGDVSLPATLSASGKVTRGRFRAQRG